MGSGYKSVGGLALWMGVTFAIFLAIRVVVKDGMPTKQDVIFHVCWNLTLWFAYQIGELRREVRERFPK